MIRKIINKKISKIKGEDYEVDKAISSSYLFALLFKKTIQLMRGFFKRLFMKHRKKGKYVFVGKHVTLKCKSKICFGNGIILNDYCYIDALSKNGVFFGNNVSIGRYTTIECTGVIRNLGESLRIEDNVGIGPNCFFSIRGNVHISKDTIIGPGVKILSENHLFNSHDLPIRLQGENRGDVFIGNDCWIGANAVILSGVKIGNGCVIGAGSIVTKDVEPFSVVAGIPAKVIRKR